MATTCVDLLVLVIQFQTVQPFPELLAFFLLLLLPESIPESTVTMCIFIKLVVPLLQAISEATECASKPVSLLDS